MKEATVNAKVTDSWLMKVCGGSVRELTPDRAYTVACRMGRLGPWWLRKEVLDAAREHGRRLFGQGVDFSNWEPVGRVPAECGSCWIVLVNKDLEHLGLLRPAFVLPLRWQSGRTHHPHLPATLCKVADRVLEALRKDQDDELKTEQWGLAPAPEELLVEHDLSELGWSFESAWASLAGGVLLARWQGKPDATVWASGEWKEDAGMIEVNGLPAKVAVAAEFGARVFFVPEEQKEEARVACEEQGGLGELEIAPLAAGKPKLRDALQDYLARIEVPPARDAPREIRQEYFLRIPTDELAREYYKKNILPEVREGDVAIRDLRSLEASHLVTIQSKGFFLVDLAYGVVQPSRCLLLYNSEMAEEAKENANQLTNCILREFFQQDHEALVEEFSQLIQDFLGDTPPEKLVVDMTSGQRIMNLSLYDAVPRGCQILCCQTEFAPKTRRPKPFTETFHLWKKT